MMTCGSPCESCASLTPSLSLLLFIFPIFCLVVPVSSLSRQRWGLYYPHQTAMCVYPSPNPTGDAGKREDLLITRHSAVI
jgi:hypothetical protein